ncbi:hypothetical protein [Ancylobacter moscoviensis]
MSAGSRIAPSGRNLSPAALIEARQLYEETNVPVESIAVLLGIHKTTLYRHARHKGWRSRLLDGRVPSAVAGQTPVPAGPLTEAASVQPGVAAPDFSALAAGVPEALGGEVSGGKVSGGEASGGETAGTPVAGRDKLPRGELIARLVRRIEAEIAAIERLIARAGCERVTDGVAETERAARTLAVLVRSLRELSALETSGPDGDEDEASRDADAFRRELGETLERVLAAGEAP